MSQLKYHETATENYDFRFIVVKLSVCTRYWKIKPIDMGGNVDSVVQPTKKLVIKKKKNIPDAEDSSRNAERETIRTWVFR